MKKYLMTGIAALALCAGFTSCSHDLDVPSPEKMKEMEAQKIVEKYNKAFEATFGKPKANHNWGFGPTAAARTRGDSEYANGNMWAAKDDGRYLVPDPLTEGQKARVQYFYQMNQKNSVNQSYGNIDFFMQQVYTGGTDPTGESPEKYRSIANKLRLQNNPAEVPDLEGGIHMDHLIAGTANAHINNFNGGSCGTYPNVLNNDPVVLAAYPNASDGGYMANQNEQYHHPDQIELMLNTNTDYFGYANSDDSDVRIDRYWQVSAATIDAYITAHQSDYNTWLTAKSTRVGHTIEDKVVNDFWGQLGRGFIGFDYDMLIQQSCFATKTWDGDNIYLRTGDAEKGSSFHKAWKDGALVDYNGFDENYQYNENDVRYLSDQTNFYSGEVRTLTLNDLYVKYDENGVKTTTDGNIWYAINLDKIEDMLDDGFLPVKGKKLEEWVKIGNTADGYYSDWIVTFMPALHYTNEEPPTPTTLSLRVMAEDLSVTDPSHDFDFNDVVFDVIRVDDDNAKIILQAAGGTLPLRVNSTDGVGGFEVHAKFGVETNVMVNTRWKGAARVPAVDCGTITITGGFSEDNFYETVRNIRVEVEKTGSDGDKVWVVLSAPKDNTAPSKFGCPIDTDWVDERVFIDDIYTFSEWVTGATYTLEAREKE